MIDPQKQLTWDHKCSQSLGHQPENMQELDPDTIANVQLSLPLDPLTSKTEVVPCHWIPFPLFLDCLVGPQ